MNSILKTMSMFLILLVSMFTFPLSASATSLVSLNEIRVNDVDVTFGGKVFVEKGENLDITVELLSPVDYKDVRVKASIEGYEFDNISDSTDIFDIEGSTGIYTKTLHLTVPTDIDTEDYTLNIEIVNSLGIKTLSNIVLQVREARHGVAIQDVILRPTSTVEAGRSLQVDVRVENTGSRKEEDIRVTASIAGLGVATRDYIDELGYVETDEDDDETSKTLTLYLPIPEDAITGNYELSVDVDYNKAHDTLSAKSQVYVEGMSQTPTAIDTIISIDALSKSAVKGEAVSYRLMLANLGSAEKVYSLSVSGVESWADVTISPAFIRVAPNGAGELSLTVNPKSISTVGEHSFTLKIKEGDNTLKDITLNALVSEGSIWASAKGALEVGFAVLVSLLVILGLVVAFKKLGRKQESEPEPIISDGQSYY